MPQGKGTYGSKRGRPAKKKPVTGKKSTAGKKPAAGKSKMPPAMQKRMEMMKKKSAKK